MRKNVQKKMRAAGFQSLMMTGKHNVKIRYGTVRSTFTANTDREPGKERVSTTVYV